jgi:hypothetical protein
VSEPLWSEHRRPSPFPATVVVFVLRARNRCVRAPQVSKV